MSDDVLYLDEAAIRSIINQLDAYTMELISLVMWTDLSSSVLEETRCQSGTALARLDNLVSQSVEAMGGVLTRQRNYLERIINEFAATEAKLAEEARQVTGG